MLLLADSITVPVAALSAVAVALALVGAIASLASKVGRYEQQMVHATARIDALERRDKELADSITTALRELDAKLVAVHEKLSALALAMAEQRGRADATGSHRPVR